MQFFMLLAILASTPAFADHELKGRDVAAGATGYADNCAACHGEKLEGQPNWRTPGDDGALPAPPHDASGHTWHHDNALLFNYTKLGGQKLLEMNGIVDFKSGMPGFGEQLSDAQIWDILAYIQSTWPSKVQEANASLNPKHGN